MSERRLFEIYEEADQKKEFSGIKMLEEDSQLGEVIVSGRVPDEVLAKLRETAKREPGLYQFYSPFEHDGQHYGFMIERNELES